MFTVYVLYSESTARYYIGHTEKLVVRTAQHNKCRVKSTKAGVPWRLVYTEEYLTKREAYKREIQIKAFKGGEGFKRLVNN